MRRPDEERSASLRDFVLDVPYVIAFDLIPPRSALNDLLQQGRIAGSMSPGALWTPFQVTAAEYGELVDSLVCCDLDNLRSQGVARFVPERVKIAPPAAAGLSFIEWMHFLRETRDGK